MVRKSIEDLDRNKNDNSLMDLMYNIRTNDESITCRDNNTDSLTDITYMTKETRKKSNTATTGTTASDNDNNNGSADNKHHYTMKNKDTMVKLFVEKSYPSMYRK